MLAYITVSIETLRRLLLLHEIVFSQPQYTISGPDLEYASKKMMIEAIRYHLKVGEVFYYADEFNVSLLPTLRAMWRPKGQQVVIQTPGQQATYYGIGQSTIARVKRSSNSSSTSGVKRLR